MMECLTKTDKSESFKDDDKENVEEEKEVVKLCNVCMAPATKMCHACRTRIYCSRGCQKADWDQHRRYCRPPPTPTERKAAIKKDCDDFGFPFERIQAMASNPDDAKSLEDAFSDAVGRIIKLETGQDPDESKWPVLDDDWQLDKDEVWDELAALPPARGEELAFSYMTAGTMNGETGFLFWQLTVLSSLTGKIRYAANMTPVGDTKPGRKELEQLIYLAMTRPGPASGEPFRPAYILFAHRWGRVCTADLIDKLWDKLRIRARLESREDARISAEQHGTDPEGFNFPK